MARSVYVCDQDADVAIKTMMAAVVGTAVVPAHVNWALTASAMGAGAVAIGKCYGVQLTKDEGWKFVKQIPIISTQQIYVQTTCGEGWIPIRETRCMMPSTMLATMDESATPYTRT